jgi:hypothetical protein
MTLLANGAKLAHPVHLAVKSGKQSGRTRCVETVRYLGPARSIICSGTFGRATSITLLVHGVSSTHLERREQAQKDEIE